MKAAWSMWALVATLGLVAGGTAGFYKQWKQDSAPLSAPEKETVPELSTDSFSLLLFHHALTGKKSGNVLVAPHTVSRTLSALQELAGGKTLQELRTLNLSTTTYPRSSEPRSAALLAMEQHLPRGKNAGQVMSLPFAEDLPMALSLFNGMLAPAAGEAEIQLAGSTTVTGRTKLLAGCAASFRAIWETPFFSADTRTATFDNASGGMPHHRQMRSRGMYPCVTAEDGSWRAVALPMQAQNTNPVPLVLIAILPAGSARDFASSLTPEQLTDIRRSLSAASLQDTLVEFPRLELQVHPYDMRDSLRRLGLKSLFDSENADFSQLTSQKIHLGALLQTFRVSLTDTPGKNNSGQEPDAAPGFICFNKPFIWLLADLYTATPVEFFGLVEEM